MTPPPDTIAALEAVLAVDPSARAVQFEDRWLTYAELATGVSAARRALRDAGVGPGAPVATVLPNHPGGLIGLLAVLLERACLVTISPRQHARELAQAPACAAVLGPAAAVDGQKAQALPENWAVAAQPGCVEARPGTALLVATSGSTGEPKRIPISCDAIDSVLAGVRRLARATRAPVTLRDQTTLICFPYTNLSGLLPQLLALVSGRRTALLERFEPLAVARLVAEHRMTSLALNPTAMRMLIDAGLPRDALASVRYVRSGSAPLRPELAVEFEARFGAKVLQSYGQTEVGGEVIGWSRADHDGFAESKRGSVGRPHAGVDVRIVAPDGPPDGALPAGEVGELWLHGVRNVHGWHRTGDLGHIDEDGFVWIDGRADDVIVCGGFNIVPAALERVLERHPSVKEAAVVGRHDGRLGEVPVALLVLHRARPCTEDDLRAHCRRELELYLAPREFVVLDDLPRTEMGKLHGPSLRRLASADRSRT